MCLESQAWAYHSAAVPAVCVVLTRARRCEPPRRPFENTDIGVLPDCCRDTARFRNRPRCGEGRTRAVRMAFHRTPSIVPIHADPVERAAGHTSSSETREGRGDLCGTFRIGVLDTWSRGLLWRTTDTAQTHMKRSKTPSIMFQSDTIRPEI